MEIRKFIEETVIELYRTAHLDKWDQMSQSSRTPAIFGDREEEVVEYCKNNRGLLGISTYGGRFGTYRGFNVTSSSLMAKCMEAKKENIKNNKGNRGAWG